MAAIDNSAQWDAIPEKSRDADGTVDRVRDPPAALKPVLAAIKEKCSVENVDLIDVFTSAGASQFGTLQTARFVSALTVSFPRFRIEQEIFDAIVDAYGIGMKNPVGQSESIAWMDFCEDVRDAIDTTPELVATGLAHTRGSTLSFKTLSQTREQLIDL